MFWDINDSKIWKSITQSILFSEIGPATFAHGGDLLVGVCSGGYTAGCRPHDDKCYCGPSTGAADSSKYVNLANYGPWLKTTVDYNL